MLRQIARIYALLEPQTRRGLAWMYVLMGTSAGLEMLGLGLLVPLLQVLLSPESVDKVPLVGPVLANWLEAQPKQTLAVLCMIVAGFFVAKSAALAWIGWAQNDFVLRHQAAYAERMLRGYLAGPYESLMGRNSAELIRNITLLSIRLFVKGVLPLLQIGTELLMTAGIVLLMMLLDPLLTLGVGGAMAAAVLLFYGLIRRKLHDWGQATISCEREALLWLNQSLAAPKITKLGGFADFFATRFGTPTRAKARVMAFSQIAPTWPRLFLEAAAVVTLVLVVVLAVIVQDRPASTILPTLAVLGVAAIRLLPSASKVIGALSLLRENQGGVDILATEAKTWGTPSSHDADLPALSREVRMEGVGYTYPGASSEALSDIDLVIEKGISLGLVGRSGAGKTTLADLILGLITSSSGRILVDGVALPPDPAGWHRQIGYVPQDVYLLDDTLARNVALGLADSEIDRSRLADVLRTAQLESFVAGLPEGADTVLGERGSLISGGQKQRIGIARALYRRPRLLVLDEATSALDSETEHQVAAAIRAIAGKTTLVIIAHRLSTVRHCQKIAFMDKGRVVDCGTFDELNRRNRNFARLVTLGEASA